MTRLHQYHSPHCPESGLVSANESTETDRERYKMADRLLPVQQSAPSPMRFVSNGYRVHFWWAMYVRV